MLTNFVTYILEIDATITTINRINQWLHNNNITPILFCTQILPPRNRVIIVCELNNLAAGYIYRRLRKLQGVYFAECLVPKQYLVRSVPKDVLQSLELDQ